MHLRTCALFTALVMIGACGRPEPESANRGETNASVPAPANAAEEEGRLEPPAPGEPGALPDDRRPVLEAPFAATSAQGAANVVQSYFALVEAGRHAEARRLWSDGDRASGMSEADFAAAFRRYREYHALVGAPGRIEGAAGSLYVEVPVQVYGRLAGGEAFSRTGTVTLRRVNDVPGSTADQRRWHIARINIESPG